MIFIVKVTNKEGEQRPKLISFLTMFDKTIQAIFQNGHPKFQEEIIFSSNISVGDALANFKVKDVHFHKDFGLFLTLKNHSLENLTHLYYLPRSSIFTGKDSN